MEKINHGLIALYRTAQGAYRERTFATIQRRYDLNPVLNTRAPEFKLDPLFLKHKK